MLHGGEPRITVHRIRMEFLIRAWQHLPLSVANMLGLE